MTLTKVMQKKLTSPIGDLYLVASPEGIVAISTESTKLYAQFFDRRAEAILQKAKRQLQEYFAGHRKKFELPYDLSGTEFQKKVWAALAKIPYGQTCSYQDVARRVRKPKAMRAVGSANGRNPLCIVIPCHRVIAADGTLGGYSGGVEIKRKLLALESRI